MVIIFLHILYLLTIHCFTRDVAVILSSAAGFVAVVGLEGSKKELKDWYLIDGKRAELPLSEAGIILSLSSLHICYSLATKTRKRFRLGPA